jgi:hypothetical protein
MAFARARSALSTACLGLMASAILAAPALADTAFGGDPNQAPNAGATCGQDPPGYPGARNISCLWETTDASGVSSDYVPFSASGGSGTITSVTLPAMPAPGPMQVVVLTAALATTTDPGHPDFACCQTKAISPTFTVPAGKVTTVPLNLHVTSSDVNDPNKPGDTAFSDIMALSVLSPTATLPLRYPGPNQLVNAIAYPAPSAPSGEFAGYGTTSGYQLLARFTLSTGDTVGGGGGGGTVISPAGGLKLRKAIGVPAGARNITLGTASNPPTAATRQRLTATPAALGATAAKKKAKRKTIGTGKTRIKAGKTAKVRVKLGRTARRRLAHGHRVKCTLTVVATGASGAKTTVTRSVTLKPKAKKKK